jgi:hypothetical protein
LDNLKKDVGGDTKRRIQRPYGTANLRAQKKEFLKCAVGAAGGEGFVVGMKNAVGVLAWLRKCRMDGGIHWQVVS